MALTFGELYQQRLQTQQPEQQAQPTAITEQQMRVPTKAETEYSTVPGTLNYLPLSQRTLPMAQRQVRLISPNPSAITEQPWFPQFYQYMQHQQMPRQQYMQPRQGFQQMPQQYPYTSGYRQTGYGYPQQRQWQPYNPGGMTTSQYRSPIGGYTPYQGPSVGGLGGPWGFEPQAPPTPEPQVLDVYPLEPMEPVQQPATPVAYPGGTDRTTYVHRSGIGGIKYTPAGIL